jgi:hypothetical protein
MTGWGKVMRTFQAETEAVTQTILTQLPAVRPRSGRHALRLATGSAYSVGVEVGLAIAARDPAAATRLLAFFTDVVQASDPVAIHARARQVDDWIGSARTDA